MLARHAAQGFMKCAYAHSIKFATGFKFSKSGASIRMRHLGHGPRLHSNVRNVGRSRVVEETFRKYFGYLARCDGKFGIQTLKIENFGSKWDENAEFDSAKF